MTSRDDAAREAAGDFGDPFRPVTADERAYELTLGPTVDPLWVAVKRLVPDGGAGRDALYTRLDSAEKRAERAEAELAAIKERNEEVGQDEGWWIGGAWGDYGEPVVPLRILSYVIGGELDQKVESVDPGFALTYAEQVARADRAEAEVAALPRRWGMRVEHPGPWGLPCVYECESEDDARAIIAEYQEAYPTERFTLVSWLVTEPEEVTS